MSRDWSKGSTRQWRRTRRQVLERDGHRCQLQLDGRTHNDGGDDDQDEDQAGA